MSVRALVVTLVTVTLPAPVTQYWKLHDNAWAQLTGATFAGNTETFTLTDGHPDVHRLTSAAGFTPR